LPCSFSQEFDTFFDRSVGDVIKELPEQFAKGAEDLVELA
jgi:hypothetical protein